MKRKMSCGPRLGKWVHQLPGVVTFAYNLRFRRVIARWKGIVEEIHFGGSIVPLDIIENLDTEKPSFGPSKWPRKLKPTKNSKLSKLLENYFEPFGKGGWPPIFTWIKLKQYSHWFFLWTEAWSLQTFKFSPIKPHQATIYFCYNNVILFKVPLYHDSIFESRFWLLILYKVLCNFLNN